MNLLQNRVPHPLDIDDVRFDGQVELLVEELPDGHQFASTSDCLSTASSVSSASTFGGCAFTAASVYCAGSIASTGE